MTTTKSTNSTRRSLLLYLGLGMVLILGMVVVLRILRLPVLEDVTVRAVDAKGRPVEGIMVLSESPLGGGQALGVTDAEGRVSGAELSRHDPLEQMLGLSLKPNIIGYVATPTPLETETKLVVPAVGTLVVALTNADGTPYSYPSLSKLGFQIQWTVSSTGKTRRITSSQRNLDAAGEASFTPVAVGSKLTLRYTGLVLRIDKDQREITGPAKRNETKRIEIRLPVDPRILTGHVVDDQGRPVVGQIGFNVRGPKAHGSGGEMQGWTLVTDDKGVFRFLVGPKFFEAGTIEFSTHGLSASKDFRFDPATPKRDLGEIVLRPKND